MVCLFTPQLSLVLNAPNHGGWPGWVDPSGWLHIEMVYCLQTVTHPSTNQAQRRVTLLIETNALPLSQTAIQCIVIKQIIQTSRSVGVWFGCFCSSYRRSLRELSNSLRLQSKHNTAQTLSALWTSKKTNNSKCIKITDSSSTITSSFCLTHLQHIYNKKLSYRLETGRQQRISL